MPMLWEEERYVRFYTRNTPEWCALSVQARGLFGLIMREVNRAGILNVGRLGLKGVAVAVRGDWAYLEGPLQELLEDGCVVFRQDRGEILLPNFIVAQETPQSDAARKRKSREVARDACLGDVTNRDATSQNVTESHVESSAVTAGHSVLCLTDPDRTEPRERAREGDAEKGRSDPEPRPTPPQPNPDIPPIVRISSPPEVLAREAPLSPRHRAILDGFAMSAGVELDAESEWLKFREHRFEAGKTVSFDWDGSWRKWLMDSVKYARKERLQAKPGIERGRRHRAVVATDVRQRPADEGEFDCLAEVRAECGGP